MRADVPGIELDRYYPWLHRFALLTAALTYGLLVLGAVVTSYDFGMADTKWPTPPWYLAWLALGQGDPHRGVAFYIEHSHRQLAWTVGACTVILAVWLYTREKGQRWSAAAALALVSVVGLLGGLRVILVQRAVAVVHTALAQCFFALCVSLVLVTSRGWKTRVALEVPDAGKLRRLGVLTSGLVLAQIVAGALLRHLGEGPAGLWLGLHLFLALAVIVHIGLLARRVFLAHAQQARLRLPVELLCVLGAVQLMLGVAAWTTSSGFGPYATSSPTVGQAVASTAHMALGALILAVAVFWTLRVFGELAPLGIVESAEKHAAPLLEGTP